jgi:hypothetical protein
MDDKFNQILKDFSELSGDYRGEIFAAELLKSGLSFDKIYFKTLSVFKRPTSRDIESVKLDIKENGTDQVMLELNREGLYDMLPEGIFHFKNEKNGKNDKEGILKDIERTRKEEKAARKFFGPFENEFFQLRLQLEIKKMSLLQPGSGDANRDIFESIFGTEKLLNEQQILILLYILPIVHKIRGDIDKIAYCLNIIIKYKVNIKLVKKHSNISFNGILPPLGYAKLGIDTVAGSSFKSQDFNYEIHINGIEKEKLPSFFTGGANYAIVQYISAFLFPSNAIFVLKLHVKEKDKNAFLSSEKNDAYLGFNCYI